MRLKIILILLSGLVFLNQTQAEKLAEETSVSATKEAKGATRIVISTSGPAKFKSYWLDEPPRLVVKFKSRNIVSKIEEEVIVNQGVIKRIASSYFGRGRNRSLKSLTFELTQKAPYRIWQENNTILLDIQTPPEAPVFSVEGEKIFTESEAGDAMIKRLEAMDVALMQIAGSEVSLEIPEVSLRPPEVKIIDETSVEVDKAEEEAVLPKTIVLPAAEHTKEKKSMVGTMIFWLAGLGLISGLGFLIWRRYRLNIAEELKKVQSELEQRDKQIENERLVRKTVEQTSLQREKEYQQLKSTLVKKGLLKEVLSPEEREKSWLPGKSPERRQFSRLGLSRDYSRTIILRIKSQDRPESLKSFANNISANGLCLEAKEELAKNDLINLKLFFYGDIVPMMKIQALIVWKRIVAPINYYGVYFDLVEEKDKSELNRYIESKIGETATEKA